MLNRYQRHVSPASTVIRRSLNLLKTSTTYQFQVVGKCDVFIALHWSVFLCVVGTFNLNGALISFLNTLFNAAGH
jgi:hypothetical protein